MSDVATSRYRDVTISGTGSFGVDSANIFLPTWDNGDGGGVRHSRKRWQPGVTITWWGVSLVVTLTLSENWATSGTPHPSVTLAIQRGTVTKSVTVTGAAIGINPWSEPARSALQYFNTSQGSFSFSEVVHCVQHFGAVTVPATLAVEPYEARTAGSFTCTASVTVAFVDMLGPGTQNIAASVTMTDADIPGFAGTTYTDYDYAFAYGGIGAHFDDGCTIGFDQPGLISTYTGVNTVYGACQLSGNGSGVTFHWTGGDAGLNPSWDGSTSPSAAIRFAPSWAFTANAACYRYRDAAAVATTIGHYYGTYHVGDFNAGSAYRYPASGLQHYVNLDSFISGQGSGGSAGLGFQPGPPPALTLTGSSYGPVARLLQVPGQPIGGATTFQVDPAWANAYPTYRKSLHPAPNPYTLGAKLWQPFLQGTIQWASMHRFTLFETGGVATATTAGSASSDTAFHVVSEAGFAAGDTIIVGPPATPATYTVASVSPGVINITATVGAVFPAGTAIYKSGSRWAAAPGCTAAAPPASFVPPTISLVSGSGIDGNALQVEFAAGGAATPWSAVTVVDSYLLRHQGYRYARLRLKHTQPATTLTADALIGSTTLHVADSSAFRVGDTIQVAAEVVTVVSVAALILTVTATTLAHPNGSAVTRLAGAAIIFGLYGTKVMGGSNPNPQLGWQVGPPSARITADVAAGATFLPCVPVTGFEIGQNVVIGAGATQETGTVTAVATGGSPGVSVGAVAHAHLHGEKVFLLPDQWYNMWLDLAQPDLLGVAASPNGVWTKAAALYPPSLFFPDPPGANLRGAQVSIYFESPGTYTLDYLEGYYATDGTRTPRLFFPFLDGRGAAFGLSAYEDVTQGAWTPSSSYDQQDKIRSLANGVEAFVSAIITVGTGAVTSIDAFIQYLATRLDTAANDTGITIVRGTAGDPDPLAVFGPLNIGQFAFDASTGYGLKPAADTAQEMRGQLRTDVRHCGAYNGAGDLMVTSGGYDPVIAFTLDWLWEGEALVTFGGNLSGSPSVTLVDNDTEAVIASGAPDDDGLVRLPAKYGVVRPRSNTDDSAQWVMGPPFTWTTLGMTMNADWMKASAVDDQIDPTGYLANATGSAPLQAPATAGATTFDVLQTAGGAPFNTGDNFYLGADTGAITAQSFIGPTPPGALPSGDIWQITVSPALTGAHAVGEMVRAYSRRLFAILDRYQTVVYLYGHAFLGMTNLHDRAGAYHVATANAGRIHYWRSDTPAPPGPGTAWDLEVDATAGPTDSEPAIAASAIDRIGLLFTRSGSIMLTWTDDDGATWKDPPMTLFTGGKHPNNAETDIGTVIHAAWIDGNIRAREEFAPEQFSDPWTFVDGSGAALTVDDDYFSFTLAPEGAARHVLAVRQSGDVVHWTSADDARTWQQVT